ncbi:MAG: hypothetical protein IPF63_12360 [Bacteroidetes bacterium]|nr:hypothetical protein [Bacteroidota bacterium]
MKNIAFLIYLFDPNAERTGGLYGSGALEHATSSVYFMPILQKVEFEIIWLMWHHMSFYT